MSEPTNGAADAAKKPENHPEINVLGQYIKDLSFENPRAPASLRGPGNQPNIQVNFNVQAQNLEEDAFEVMLGLEAIAKNDEGNLYTFELVYAGVFRLKNLPEQALKPVLFIECPALLFPFARKIVADATREGGFPPLLLDPIDFAALYRQRLAKDAENAEPVQKAEQ